MKTAALMLVCLLLLAAQAMNCWAADDDTLKRPNVLFIAIDDLRPELGCYGASHIKSPNIDALAARGLAFNRAYCQYALCNPSRASLLSGRRPDSIRVYELGTFVRAHAPDIVTLPQFFRERGYETRSFGKIYHVSHGNRDDERSWSEAPWYSPKSDRQQKKSAATGMKVHLTAAPARPQRGRKESGSPPRPVDPHANELFFGAPDVADDDLLDGKIANRAVSTLQELKGAPFFLAVGFHRPHMPWVAPKKYWELYDPAQIKLAPYQSLPEGAPKFATNDSSEFRRYKDVPNTGPIPDEMQRIAIHGYYASVSYIDSLVGRLLAALDEFGLRENTIVVVWGDHGYQLGDHGTWNKRTNWEASARVPLLVHVPGQKRPGARTDALVELVDIYPTLAELCDLDPPAGLEGQSFVPLLSNPDKPWKAAAFTMYRKPLPGMGDGFGRAMRTDRYRFIEWSSPGSKKRVYELYDELTDPLERFNIADRPGNTELVERLSKELHAHMPHLAK